MSFRKKAALVGSSWSLPRAAKKFIQLQVLFGGMGSILTLFVNTFLMNAYGSFADEVLIYNAVMALVQPVSMVTAMALTAKKDALFTQRIGFMFYGIALATLCFFGEKVSPLYPLFAVLLSFGAGYYYSVYSSQMLFYTQDEYRDLIAGIINLLGAVISLFLPLLSGFLISRLGSRTGYQIVFGIAAVLAVAALFTNRHLPQIPKHEKGSAMKKVCRTMLGSKNGRRILAVSGLSNCRGFTLPVFVTLLFYNLVPNEFLISVNSTVASVATIIGATLYSRLVHANTRIRASLIAVCVLVCPCLGMLTGISVFWIMLFNALNGFFTTYLSTPSLNTHFKVTEALGLHGEYGAEIHLLREFFVSAGRIAGLFLVWVVPKTNAGAVTVLGAMILTAVLEVVLLKVIDHASHLDRSER